MTHVRELPLIRAVVTARLAAGMVAGRDAQLERAIQWCLDELEKNPPRRPARPAYKVRVDRR